MDTVFVILGGFLIGLGFSTHNFITVLIGVVLLALNTFVKE